MNRFVFGTALLVLAPVLSGCPSSGFYLTAAPTPLPVPTPAPTAAPYPFDPAAGAATSLGAGVLGRKMNGTPPLPTAFRVADIQDIQFNPRTPGDTANASLLLVLQQINAAPVVATAPATRGAAADSSAAAPETTATLVGGTKDGPYRLAGVLVPGPAGPVGGGLQDPDQLALQAEASRRLIEAVSRWVRLTGTFAPTAPATGATPVATPTIAPTPASAPRSRVRGRAVATPVPTAPSLVDPSQELDVYQDPKYPVDSDGRPLVQIFFKSAGGSGKGGIAAGTQLSLNRMLIRSGLAVVDLYSPTVFDQQTWLLDEAYARHRKLGLWGLQLNGKTLSLQQRVPAPSSGSGASAHVSVTNGVPTRPGQPSRPGTRPLTSATQVPGTLTPTLAPPAFPRVVTQSGSKVTRGATSAVKLPPPSDAISAAPATDAASSSGSSPGSSSSSSGSPSR